MDLCSPAFCCVAADNSLRALLKSFCSDDRLERRTAEAERKASHVIRQPKAAPEAASNRSDEMLMILDYCDSRDSAAGSKAEVCLRRRFGPGRAWDKSKRGRLRVPVCCRCRAVTSFSCRAFS